METQPQPETDPLGAVPAPTFRLADYQAMPMGRLQAEAEQAGVPDRFGFDRQELVFALQLHGLAPGATGLATGILDVRPEGFGFLRSPRAQCRVGADDVYLSPNQIGRLRLRTGQMLEGIIRAPRDGESYFALVRVLKVDGAEVADSVRRVPFHETTPVLPHTRLELGYRDCPPFLRMIDVLAPLGLGQRVLVQTPPGSRRAELLRQIAEGVLRSQPDARVVLLLADQRPEEHTEACRGIADDPRTEVFATTFDEAPERHAEAMQLAHARVRRLVEAGRDVVLLVDSLTHLTRAYNAAVPHSGKIICAGLDAHALHRPRELFACARQTEEGPSLTVIATLLVETGSPVDDAIALGFAGKANATVVLSGELIRRHVYPGIEVHATRTRWEDHLLDPGHLAKIRHLRRGFENVTDELAVRSLAEMIATSADNDALLARLPD